MTFKRSPQRGRMESELFGSDLRVVDRLGEGTYSEVFRVRSHKTQAFYAIKRLKRRYKTLEMVNSISEILVLRVLQGHPNILTLHEVLYDSNHGYVALVTELMDMNLYDLLKNRKDPLDEKVALLLIFQLIKAIQHIHSKNLFHRDIKPENCLVNKVSMELKLADFGSAKQSTDPGHLTEYIATRWYRAPEAILTAGSYGPPVDIWAAGCVLFEILTGRPLFPGTTQLDQINKIHNVLGTPGRQVIASYMENPASHMNFAFPPRNTENIQHLLPNVSNQTVDLIVQMLKYDQNERITADEALSHPCFFELRSIEREFLRSGSKGAFSSFALSYNRSVPCNQKNPISFVEQTILMQPHLTPNNSKSTSLASEDKIKRSEVKLTAQKADPIRRPLIHHEPIHRLRRNPLLKGVLYQKPRPDILQPRLQPIVGHRAVFR